LTIYVLQERPHPRAEGHKQYRFVEEGSSTAIVTELGTIVEEEFAIGCQEYQKFLTLLQTVYSNGEDLEDSL
jgi:hypothetical protein